MYFSKLVYQNLKSIVVVPHFVAFHADKDDGDDGAHEENAANETPAMKATTWWWTGRHGGAAGSLRITCC